VRQAAITAGIVKELTRLDKLKRAWRGASAEERREFLEWAGDRSAETGSA
jgi:hypothetical protein